MITKPLLTFLLLFGLFAAAQTPIDMTPKLDGIVRYQRITYDKKGAIYTVVFRNYSEALVLQYTNGAWKDISAGMPPIKHTSKLQGSGNGVVFSGYSKDFERLIGVWDGTSWTTLPLKQLRGKVNSFSVDDNGVLWATGAFGEGGKTYLLATWQNGQFKVQGPPMEDRKMVEMVLDESYALYTRGSEKVTPFIQVANKGEGKQQFFLTTEGKQWGYLISDTFPLNFFNEMAATSTKQVFVVQSCGGTKNKCLLYWNNPTWSLLPFDESFKNDEIFCLTADGEGDLLVGGMTRTSKGYVVLKWDEEKWSAFGPPVDKPIHEMIWLDGKIYAITGEESKTITVIPAAASPSPDAPAKYLELDAKAKEVWDIADGYWASETRLVRDIKEKFHRFSSSGAGASYSLLLEQLQKGCDTLGTVWYETHKKVDALKFKKQKNVLAKQLQEQLQRLSNCKTFVEATLKATTGQNRQDYTQYMKLAWESFAKLQDMWVLNHVFAKEYKRRNGL